MPVTSPRRDKSVGGPTETSAQTQKDQKLAEAIISTLAFFSLYDLPLSKKRLQELLLGYKASSEEVDRMLQVLIEDGKIKSSINLYSIKPWNPATYNANQLELTRKWQKIDSYFHWLAVLPFVRGISVINSIALGTSDADSDIDFFVMTAKNRLYFVRSVIIVLFRLLGVYKTRQKIKDRFCFGFFISQDALSLQELLLQPEDPYFVFWLANMRPILSEASYDGLIAANLWLYDYFPNFKPELRHATARQVNLFIRILKTALEILLWLPAIILEPILRGIHIRHTFKLAENRSPNSTTIANAQMLKLHGYDVRSEVAERYREALQSVR